MYLTKSDIKGLVTSEQKYTTLPSSVADKVLSSKDLSSTEKVLMFYFLRNSYLGYNDEIVIIKSISEIAKSISKSSGTVSDSLKSLELKGWICQKESEFYKSKEKRLVSEKLIDSLEIKKEIKEKIKTEAPSSPVSSKSKISSSEYISLMTRAAKLKPGSKEHKKVVSILEASEVLSGGDNPVSYGSPTLRSSRKPAHKKPISPSTGGIKVSKKILEVIKIKSESLMNDLPNKTKEDIAGEIIYSVSIGSFRNSEPLKAVRAICKLMLSGRWTSPKGYSKNDLRVSVDGGLASVF